MPSVINPSSANQRFPQNTNPIRTQIRLITHPCPLFSHLSVSPAIFRRRVHRNGTPTHALASRACEHRSVGVRGSAVIEELSPDDCFSSPPPPTSAAASRLANRAPGLWANYRKNIDGAGIDGHRGFSGMRRYFASLGRSSE